MTLNNIIVPNWPAPKNVHAIQTTRLRANIHAPSRASSQTPYTFNTPYDDFNLGAHVGDDALKVAQNRQSLSQFVPSEPVWLNQVHGINVVDAAQTDCITNADASFTTQKNVVCVTMTADCLPILICDTAGTLAASIHAGWRSLCDGVIEATIAKLNAKPADLMAWFGPAIGPNAFEVGAEVREQFIAQDGQAQAAFKPRQDKFLANIYQIATQRLNNLGITQIYGGGIDTDFCTFTQKQQFYSYRRDGATGRMATLIWLA
jgi:polyphenol oxidase